MTQAQKVIKYLALAFALFLIVIIISSITFGIYTAVNVLGLVDNNDKKIIDLVKTEHSELTNYLDIDINSSNLKIKNGNSFYSETNNGDIEYKQDGNKLIIKEKGKKWFSINKSTDLIIYVPEDMVFNNIDIDNGAGKVSIDKIDTEELDLDLGAGKTVINSINSNKTSISTGAGNFIIKSGNLNDLDFDMGVGSVEITSLITGNSKIDTGVGSLKINLIGSLYDYRIKVDKGLGSVHIDNDKVSDGKIIGNGINFIDINGGVGSIKVNFKEVK